MQPDSRLNARRPGVAITAATPQLNELARAREACDVLSVAAIGRAQVRSRRQRPGGEAPEDD
jgi:hypothetical protein